MHDTAHPALAALHPAVRAWFARTYGEPSPPQALGWPAIAAGRNVLLLAPTGSGKTLAAFLQCLSHLYERGADDGVRVLYISPLKALNNDIRKNLDEPLDGIAAEAARMGLALPRPRAAVRTGDTPARERREMLARPPQILITTPESLFLLLSSRAREILRPVRYVIVDEIHALFPNKRGVHLAVSLERLADLAGRSFQRIGLSATLRPPEEVAAFLVGGEPDAAGAWRQRPAEIIDTSQRKDLDLRILLPVGDLRVLPDKTIWPGVYRQLLALIREHRSTLVFVNNRRAAERITAGLNDLAGETVARTHHGSLAREKRLEVEDLLKRGRLPCLVATSSLELGLDVGAIDLVVQIESPKGIARGLQRVGRAGHVAGLPSKGRIIPKSRGDLLECAAVAREMRTGLVEESHAPENCLDVLAQQLVALVCPEERPADELFAIVRRAYPYRRLPRDRFDRVLGMLAGDYDQDNHLGLRPRLYWDRVNGLVRAADRGRRLVYTSGGVIPDRGYYGVYLAGANIRLGELDEEFVCERRIGDRFLLGTSAWRIEELRRDRVIVTPARRGEAMPPFWKGEVPGRPPELGVRFGRFLEEAAAHLQSGDFDAWASAECLMDGTAARNLRHYLEAQIKAVGALPTHRRLIVEEFRDELGEWRVMLHSPYGARIHAPLALLLRERLLGETGHELETMQDDNGILFVCPGGAEPLRIDPAALPPEDLTARLAAAARGSAAFAALFRQNAARALLLPRKPYGRQRTPFWLSRVQAADLLSVVSAYPDFPLVLETLRECLTEYYDLEGLRNLLAGLRCGEIELRRVRTPRPSPFAHALQFSFYGSYMYEADMPKGEQRFRALGLPRAALRDLLGGENLRDLLDPASLAEVDAEARGLAGRCPQSADELHDWLRRGRELPRQAPLPAGHGEDGDRFLAELRAAKRVCLLSWPANGANVEAWVATEDVPLYLAGVPGCRMVQPEGPPPAPADPAEARRRLVRRFSLTRGPFTLADLAQHYGLTREEAAASLAALEADGLVQAGEFSPGVRETEYCDVDLLQRIHRRSLARARKEIAPRGPAEYAVFLARWQGVGNPGHGMQALAEVLRRLAGLPLPHGAWAGGVLPLRVADYRDEMLERLLATGQFQWTARGRGEGMELAFFPRGEAAPRLPLRQGAASPAAPGAGSPPPASGMILEVLSTRGALFLPQIAQHTGLSGAALLEALEILMSAGEVTNDTLGPVRYFAQRRSEQLRFHLTQQALDAMGRWSVAEPGAAPDPETLARALLNRYGLAARDLARRDGFPWDDLLPVYERWEAVGTVRRGYFVAGLGGLQYALPEAVERLRLPAEEGMPGYWAVLRCDPANPYGPVLPMPEPARQADWLVLRRGEPVLAAGGTRIRLTTLAPLADEALAAALNELVRVASWSGRDRLSVVEFDGQPVQDTRAAETLQELGFERGYRELVRWA